MTYRFAISHFAWTRDLAPHMYYRSQSLWLLWWFRDHSYRGNLGQWWGGRNVWRSSLDHRCRAQCSTFKLPYWTDQVATPLPKRWGCVCICLPTLGFCMQFQGSDMTCHVTRPCQIKEVTASGSSFWMGCILIARHHVCEVGFCSLRALAEMFWFWVGDMRMWRRLPTSAIASVKIAGKSISAASIFWCVVVWPWWT